MADCSDAAKQSDHNSQIAIRKLAIQRHKNGLKLKLFETRQFTDLQIWPYSQKIF